jgi:hypothetical protein
LKQESFDLPPGVGSDDGVVPATGLLHQAHDGLLNILSLQAHCHGLRGPPLVNQHVHGATFRQRLEDSSKGHFGRLDCHTPLLKYDLQRSSLRPNGRREDEKDGS